MGIEAIQGRGVSRVAVTCDICGRGDVITCDYEKVGRRQEWLPNKGQALRKIVASGWADVKGKLHCPSCEAKRRADAAGKGGQPMKEVAAVKEPATVIASGLRRPTPKQERLIIFALEDAYDDQNKRFRGSATDKTIADELGDGIMFGWVAEIRERLFGPSGANEEVEAVRAEIAKLRTDCEARVAALTKRLDAVVAAVGPRAR